MSYTYWPEKSYDPDLSLNVANGNAHIPCGMMGYAIEQWKVPVKDLPIALMMVQAIETTMFTRGTVQEGNVTYCGVTPDQAEWYQRQLTKLLNYCIANKTPLIWG